MWSRRFFRLSAGLGGIAASGAAAAVFIAKSEAAPVEERHTVVVVGGGTGGVSVAAQLLRHRSALDVVIVDPAAKHYYQPGWTLVGAGMRNFAWSEKPFEAMVPTGAKRIKEAVVSYDPANNAVKTSSGRIIRYDQLVVAPGLEMDWKAIPGVYEAIFNADGSVRSDSPVVSNYLGGTETYNALKRFPDGGIALFTTMPGIKCGGAPIKATLLSYEVLLKGRSLTATVEYLTPGPNVFPVERYTKAIEQLFERRGINIAYKHKLSKVVLSPPGGAAAVDAAGAADAASKGGKGGSLKAGLAGVATFETPTGTVQKPFDLLHVVPPMRAPKEVRESPLAGSDGFVAVDKFTCQHVKYQNVWSLGDASSLPTSKTAAAAIAEAPVVVHNVLAVMDQAKSGAAEAAGKDGKGAGDGLVKDKGRVGEPRLAKYGGYTSCPLVFSRQPRGMMLMEFGYGGKPMETFGDPRECDGTLRGKAASLLKEYLFPAAYWHMIPRGLWYGATGPCKPTPNYEVAM